MRAEGELCILHSSGIAASPISLLSMGGVCGRRKANMLLLFSIMTLWERERNISSEDSVDELEDSVDELEDSVDELEDSVDELQDSVDEEET